MKPSSQTILSIYDELLYIKVHIFGPPKNTVHHNIIEHTTGGLMQKRHNSTANI